MRFIVPFTTLVIALGTECLPVGAHSVNHDSHNDHHHDILKRETGKIACDGTDNALLQGSIEDLKIMIPRAIQSLDLVSGYLNAATGTRANAATWAAAQYFEIIFGGPLKDSANLANSKTTVAYVKEKLNLVLNMLIAGPSYPFNIYCNDEWLSPPLEVEGNNRGKRIDIRAGAAAARKAALAAGGKRPVLRRVCTGSASSSVIAWVTAAPPLFDQPLMTICPAHLSRWNDRANEGFSLRGLLDVDISTITLAGNDPDDATHIYDLCDRSLTCSLMHELAHVNPLMFPGSTGKSKILDDGFINPDGACDDGYGWHCITSMARHDKAQPLVNADTWAYYVLGASLSKNNWSSGFPEPLTAEA